MNRCKIENVLFKIGVPAGVKGFQYIVDALLIIDKSANISMTKELYPMIAKKNNTTASRVERAIRHAFDCARNPKGNYDEVEYYIGFENCQNKNSLKKLHTRIKTEEMETNKSCHQAIHDCGIDKELIKSIVREEIKMYLEDVIK